MVTRDEMIQFATEAGKAGKAGLELRLAKTYKVRLNRGGNVEHVSLPGGTKAYFVIAQLQVEDFYITGILSNGVTAVFRPVMPTSGTGYINLGFVPYDSILSVTPVEEVPTYAPTADREGLEELAAA